MSYPVLNPAYFIAFSSSCDARDDTATQIRSNLRNPLKDFGVEISRRVEHQMVDEFSRRGLDDLLPAGEGWR